MMKIILCMLVWIMVSGVVEVSVWLNLSVLMFLFFVFIFMNPIGFNHNLMGYDFGVDSLGFNLSLLSIWVVMLMFSSSFKVYKEFFSSTYFIYLVNFLLLTLILSFSLVNLLGFYLFFEASLIPTLLIIAGWGYQPERLQAGVYFMFYTMTSSLPLLLVLLGMYSWDGSLMSFTSDEWFLDSGSDLSTISWLMFLGMIMAFLVKLPLFFVHLWLPKAHVEAPVSGSMILAGVLLKLGGYGLCRVLMKMPGLAMKMSNLMISLGLLAMCFVGFMCCRLNDMKALVAYSSVAHMGMVVIGLFTMSTLGMNGAFMMMLAHGLSSSGLFCALNMYYERTGSRSFYFNKGLLMMLPVVSLLFFMLCGSNIASPPSMNLISEIFLMGSVVGFDKLMLLVFPLGSFLGAVFTIFLFSYSQHGKMGGLTKGFWEISVVELLSLASHIVPINVLVIKFNTFMVWV